MRKPLEKNLNSHNFESIKYQSLYHYNKNLQLLKIYLRES